jgi:hypothetical protein
VLSVVAGVFLIGMGVLFWRQSSSQWWRPGETPPKVLEADREWRRFVAPIVVVCGVILVVVGLASVLSGPEENGEGQQPVDSGVDLAPPVTDGVTPARSLAVCVDRLAVDAALHDLVEAPYGDAQADASLAVLRQVRPPSDLETDWRNVLSLADAAVMEGVDPDQVSDGAMVDAGVRSAAGLDLWAVTNPCDAKGSPEDFGCQSLEACGDQVAEQPSDRNASMSAISALSAASQWEVEYCSSVGGLDRCEFSAVNGSQRADVEFSQTTEGAYFAWFAMVVG